jgi:ATP-dependent Clp protease ATP-binding subunit ClpC
VDFRYTVLIMTSNLGTEYVRKGGTLGFLQPSETDEDREAHAKIEKALKGTFRPEFLNRIDEIIMFSPLTLGEMEQIVTLQMKEIQERLNEFDVKVELTETSRKWLAKTGYDEAFGARPLRRALQKFVESPLSVALLSGDIPSGSAVSVHVKSDGSGLEFKSKGGKKQEKHEIKQAVKSEK